MVESTGAAPIYANQDDVIIPDRKQPKCLKVNRFLEKWLYFFEHTKRLLEPSKANKIKWG